MKAKSANLDLFAVRSVLFLPASNPRAIAKARTLEADFVVLDLEDAVREEDKDSARAAAVEAMLDDWPMPVAIRVNGESSRWHAADLAAVAQSAADCVVVPRTESGASLRKVRDQVARPVLAMVETSAGVLAAADIAREADALVAGTNDLRADLRLPDSASREAIGTALQLIVLAARAAGIAVFDGVFNRLSDPDGLAAECASGRSLGFDGKSLIHPDQIPVCHQAFAPTGEEIARAQTLLASFAGGAERLGSEMIERMHAESARRLLRRAGMEPPGR